MDEPVPKLCEDCWAPIPNNRRPAAQSIVDVAGRIWWRYWHAEHAPAELKEDSR